MKEKDLFQEYLDEKQDPLILRALTDRSKKNTDSSLTDNDINQDLGTYGDAIIKHCYTQMLFEEMESGLGLPNKNKDLTGNRSDLESDKTLVTKVAKKYNLLKYMKFDKKDEKKPQDYDFFEDEKDGPHKYIATAVEAMIGAIYIRTKNLNRIKKLLKSWRSF